MDLSPSSEINMVLHLFIRWAVVLGRILATVSLRQSCSTSPSWSSSYRRSSRLPPRWKWSKQIKATFVNLVPPRRKTKKEEPHCTMRRPSTTVESSTGSKSEQTYSNPKYLENLTTRYLLKCGGDELIQDKASSLKEYHYPKTSKTMTERFRAKCFYSF